MHTLSIPHAFDALLKTAAPLTTPHTTPLPTDLAVRALMAHAHQHRPLPLLGAWRLHPSHARLLERTTGGAPAGGWASLASVLGGTPLMQVTNDGFEPMWPLIRLDDTQDADIQAMMIEGLTVRMAPPTSAAGLFILLGLNPIAGLTLVRSIHNDLTPWEVRADLPQLLLLLERTKDLRPLANAFFGVVAAILEVLSMLDTKQAYTLDSFADLVLALALHARDVLYEALDERGRAQTFLVDVHELDIESLRERARDFVTLDLFDGYLLPSGLALRMDRGLFTITPSARALPEHAVFAYPGKDFRSSFFSDLVLTTRPVCAAS